MPIDALRQQGLEIGRLAAGSKYLTELPPAEAMNHLRSLEKAGVSMIWYGETFGHEAFTFAQRLLYNSDRLVIGTGIARALERPPKNAASAQFTIMEQFAGRYLAGFGASGDTRQRGQGTVEFLREYLTELDSHTFRLTGGSTRYPRVLGAYSTGTTKVARDLCDGLLTFLVTPEHTGWARGVVGADLFLSVGQWVAVGHDVDETRTIARERLAYYLKLPHQINKFRNLGFTDDDFAPPGSDHLIDRLIPNGTIDVVAERLREHFANGADQVNVSMLGATPAQEIEYFAELKRLLG
jgi:probable F420-dependent oxidoreductase